MEIEYILERKAKGSKFWERKSSGSTKVIAIRNYNANMNWYSIEEAKEEGFTFRIKTVQTIKIERI